MYTIKYLEQYNHSTAHTDWRDKKRLVSSYSLVAHHPVEGQTILAKIALYVAHTRYPATTYGTFSFRVDAHGPNDHFRQWNGKETGWGYNRECALSARALRALGIQFSKTVDKGAPIKTNMEGESLHVILRALAEDLGYTSKDYTVVEN
jgi:hypothetical protein